MLVHEYKWRYYGDRRKSKAAIITPEKKDPVSNKLGKNVVVKVSDDLTALAE